MSALVEGITSFLDSYGLIAIFLVMLVKQIGIPIPIPSDLIMLTAAAQAAAARLVLWQAFAVILAAMLAGAVAQYLLARNFGRPFLYRVGPYVGLTESRLERVVANLRKGGAVAVGVSLLTPGVRVATVPASGLAQLPYRSFVPGLAAGSAALLALHFSIGYAAGPIVDTAMRSVNLPVLGLVVALMLVGLVGWMLMRRRNAGARRGGAQVTLESLHDWTDTACPLCIAIGAVHHLRAEPHSQPGESPHRAT